MIVRDLIEKLKTLDPDKNIWVQYDTYFWYAFEIEGTVNEEKMELVSRNKDVKTGDYYFEVG